MNGLFDELQIIMHGIWQRRWLALAVAWAVCLLGWLVVALIPNVYQSRAQVFVQVQSVLPGNDNLTPLDQQQAIDQVQQTMTSAENLEKVVRSTDLGKGLTSEQQVTAQAAALKPKLRVISQQDNVFEITATASDNARSGRQNARIAAQVVGALITAFQQSNAAGGLAATHQSLKFLDQQIAAHAKDLQDADQKRADFAQRNGALLPGGVTIAQRMIDLQSDMSQIDPQLLAAQSALAGINGQLAGTRPQIAMPGAGGTSALAQAQGELAADHARGWTDSHPDVIALKNQIAALKAMGPAAAAATVPNPAYLSLTAQQAERGATVSALRTRKAQLQGDLDALTSRQVNDPGLAAEQDRLNRNYAVLKQQYDKLVSDRADVRLRGQAQSAGGNVKFRVIDPPSIASTPASPNRPLLIVGVLIVGLGAGLGAAFALGQLKTTYPTTGRLEKATGLPVIGGISEISTPGRARGFKQQMRWFYGGCGGLGVFCLLLLAVEYIQRGMNA